MYLNDGLESAMRPPQKKVIKKPTPPEEPVKSGVNIVNITADKLTTQYQRVVPPMPVSAKVETTVPSSTAVEHIVPTTMMDLAGAPKEELLRRV